MRKKSTLLPLVSIILALLTSPSAANAKSCVTTPAMTEGPYYLSNMPMRSDITEGRAGIKTTLTLTVLDKNCKAIPNAQVDIWHTDADGEYSGVDGNTGTFMRGSQITNKKGKVTFATIFPGWYPARTMHIHAKVWVNNTEALTTQFFTTDKTTSKVYGMGMYKARGQQRVNNAGDGIYQSLGSSARLLTLNSSVATKKITLAGTFVLS